MPIVKDEALPKVKWLKQCERGELVRGEIRSQAGQQWAIVGKSGSQMFEVIIVSGEGAPYWMNAYSTSEFDVPDILCLSYGTDYQVIPDYKGNIVGNDVQGAFSFLENDGRGIVISGVDAIPRFFDLKSLEVKGPRSGNVVSLKGWSIWKERMIPNGEPLQLLVCP